MSGENAARRIPLAATDASWTALLEEIDEAEPASCLTIALTGDAERARRLTRVGDLIQRGYSPIPADRSDWTVLIPRPSAVLAIVSPFGVVEDLPTWIRHVQPRRFSQHLLALDASEQFFASLSSQCGGESWHLDAFLARREWAEFIVEFVGSREIDLVQVVAARLGVDLVPALRAAYPSLQVVVDVPGKGALHDVWLAYVTARYGNVIDAFCAWQPGIAADIERALVPSSRIHLVEGGDGDRDEAIAARHEEVYGRLIAATVT